MENKDTSSDVLKGIFYIMASGLCFLVVNFFVKLLGKEQSIIGLTNKEVIPTHEIVLFRSIVSFLISFYLLRKKKLPILGNNRKWLFVRGMSGMIALTMFFYTMQHLPMAVASTIQYLAPLFTVILAVLMRTVKIRIQQWFFIGIAFLGSMLMGLGKSESGEAVSIFWLTVGVISAFFSGLAYNSIVKLRETEDTLNIVIYFPMLSIPIMALWCLFDFVTPSGITWIYLLFIGIFTQIAQVAMTRAFLIGKTNIVAPFQFLGSIYALLVGYFVFDEKLTTAMFAGIAFILFGVVMNVATNKR